MRVLRPRRRVVVAGVSLAVAAGAVTVMLALGTRGAELATVLAFALTLLVAVDQLFGARSGSDSTEQVLLASRRLARDVRLLEAGVLARLMADTGDPAPADVSFAQPASIYWRVDGGSRRGTLSEVEGYYRSLDRGRLVVLGEPGAGKTVLAIKLVLDLAAAVLAVPDSVRPFPLVPVRLSLPSFDPGGDLDTAAAEVVSARLDGWLIQHLVTVFGLSGKVARTLVTDGWILPVLDGLDEMDVDDARPQRAAAVIRALNHTARALNHTAVGSLRPVVITCRTNRYQQLSAAPDTAEDDRPARLETTPQREVVQRATVVGVEPLTVQRVIGYLVYRFPDPTDLTRIEPRWRPIIDRLTASSGNPLVVALSSPLRLFLTVTSYRHDASRPDELTRMHTADQIDDHLFARLVPAILTQHPPAGREYTPETVTRWLTTLARHLTWQGKHGSSPSDLWLHQLWPAAGGRAPRYAAAALMTAAAATSYLAVGIRWWSTMPEALTVGTVVIGVAWRASRRASDLRRLDLRALGTSAGRQRIRRLFVSEGKFWFKVSFAFGFLLLLAFAFAFAEEVGLAQWLGPVLGAGLVSGTAVGLAGGLAGALATRPPAIDRPAQLVRQGLAHLTAMIVAVGLVFGLVFGLVAGLIDEFLNGFNSGLMNGLMNGLVKGLQLALVLGLPVGFVVVANSPWPRYMVATMILARRGDLPRRPAVFLDWAYEVGLMRLSGIAVQFRHREFQDWLPTRG